MTYQAEASKAFNFPCRFIEIIGSYCGETYGVAPCAASVGTTGLSKCFNTRNADETSDCQDPDNFNDVGKTYKFCEQTGQNLIPGAIPMIVGISTTPARIDPKGGIGNRGRLTVTLQNAPWHDRGIDKYVADRSYDPLSQGTYWGKWLARNTYYTNYTIKLHSGFLGQDLVYDAANFRTRTYKITKISGPSPRGEVTITAMDLLIETIGTKSVYPEFSEGALDGPITGGPATFTLGTGQGAEYDASGKVAIDEEIIQYTRSGDTFTVVERGADNTAQEDHEEGAPVQQCKEWVNENVTDIYEELLLASGIPSANIDTAGSFTDEKSEWLESYNLSRLLPEPTPIDELIRDLTSQTGFYTWVDEVADKVKIRAIRPPNSGEVGTLDEDVNLYENSVGVSPNPRDRVTTVIVHYGIKDPFGSLTSPTNYDKEVFIEDPEKKTLYGGRRIRRIYAYWISASQTALASTLGDRLLLRLKDIPKIITGGIDAKDAGSVETGAVFDITTRELESATGASATPRMQIVEVAELSDSPLDRIYRFEAIDYQFKGRYMVLMDHTTDTENFTSATTQEKDFGGYLCNSSGKMSDGSPGYKLA